MAELYAGLKERDVSQSHPGLSPSNNAEGSSSAPDRKPVAAPTASSGLTKLDKRQIEQRIEEDRERHKRLKEQMWSVSGDGYDEADKLWDETSDFGEDDLIAAREETADMMGLSLEELDKEFGKMP